MKNLFLLLLLLAGMRISAQVNSGGSAQIIFLTRNMTLLLLETILPYNY